MQICKLLKKDIPDAMSLVKEVFDEFEAPEYSEIGVKTFHHFIQTTNIIQMMDDSDFVSWGAYEGSEIVGVIAMRGKQHISLLFVKKEFHRQGIARKLVEVVKEWCEHKYLEKKAITVNASPYGLVAYEKMGFIKISEEETKDGIRFTPMYIPLSNQRG